MALSVESLLAPVSDDAPAGEDLSYDSGRYELEQVFDSSVSVDASGEAAAAADVDWRTVLRQIESQFERTKDVWLAVYLCRAGARSGSLEVVETGAQVLAGLFERFWDSVHPQLDELGLPGRKGPCDSLAARAEFLGPLERTILVSHPRLGSYSGADFERFRTGAEAEDGYGMFRAALEDLSDDALREAVTRLENIEAAFRQADAIFTAHAAGEPSPNFGPTYEVLARLRRGVSAFLKDGGAAAASAEDADMDGGSSPVEQGAASGGGGGRLSGRVDSREDVIRVLDLINDYYRRREPSSPVPMVLERAKAWVTLDFMSVLKDIAPEGVEQAARVLVQRTEDEE